MLKTEKRDIVWCCSKWKSAFSDLGSLLFHVSTSSGPAGRSKDFSPRTWDTGTAARAPPTSTTNASLHQSGPYFSARPIKLESTQHRDCLKGPGLKKKGCCGCLHLGTLDTTPDRRRRRRWWHRTAVVAKRARARACDGHHHHVELSFCSQARLPTRNLQLQTCAVTQTTQLQSPRGRMSSVLRAADLHQGLDSENSSSPTELSRVCEGDARQARSKT